MKALRKALPFAALVLLAVLAYRDFRHQQKHLPIVWAQANNTLYDTLFSETLTSATAGTAQQNSFSGGQSMSRSFAVEYYTDGFSALSLQFETCVRNADGTLGTCTVVPNTICSSSVQPPCVIDGANPSTTTGYGTFSVSAYAPWFRVNVTSVTGTGHIFYRIYGYKGLSARNTRSGGSGGSGAGGPVLITGTLGTFTLSAATEQWQDFSLANSCASIPTRVSLCQQVVGMTGTAKNLYVWLNGTQPADGSYQLGITVNGVDTSVAAVVAAGAVNAVASDTTHSAAISAGDLVAVHPKNNSAMNASAIQMSFSFQIIP